MVDLRATNDKLWDRGARILSTLTGQSREAALELLRRADGQVKVAVVMHRRRTSAEDARRLLDARAGLLRDTLGSGDELTPSPGVPGEGIRATPYAATSSAAPQ
jgi:N-acetylmuramic acid 6-phosphate etherase